MESVDRGFSVLEKSLSTSWREGKETRDDVKCKLRGTRQEGPMYD